MVRWLGLCAFTAEGQVGPLVGELRFHKPCGMVKTRKRKRNSFFCTGQNFFQNFPAMRSTLKGTMEIAAEEEQVLCLLEKVLFISVCQLGAVSSSMGVYLQLRHFDIIVIIKKSGGKERDDTLCSILFSKSRMLF